MYPNDTRLFLLKWEFDDQNLMADVIYGINSFILRVELNIYYWNNTKGLDTIF